MKTRDLNTLKRLICDVEPFVQNRLKIQDQVNVLEVGCGLGVALSELADKYPQVTFYGINIKHHHGQIKRSNITYLYGDAGQRIALEDGTVDFAFLQHTIQFIPNKVGCFMEVFRTLKNMGQFWFEYPSHLYGRSGVPICTVTDGERIVDFKEYLTRIRNPIIIIREFPCMGEQGEYIKRNPVIEKNTHELDLNLDTCFYVDDLTPIDKKKEGYLVTHYHTIQ